MRGLARFASGRAKAQADFRLYFTNLPTHVAMSTLTRRHFLESAALVGAGSTLFPDILGATAPRGDEITLEHIRHAEVLAGLSFTDEERELMLASLERARDGYVALREVPLPNHVVPSLVFDPTIGGERAPETAAPGPITWRPAPPIPRPTTDNDLAFASVAELSALVKARIVRSVELTRLSMERLRRLDSTLHHVVTITEERAMRQAHVADDELDAGVWRGPLHGIPWGTKDLVSVAGYPTTWGAAPYRDQVIAEDADVVQRLDEAGAVLVAKLSLGALAMGDVWFGGKTRNPWNPDEGSSGSSAGPGAAVASGCVPFAIGSETLGSIVSPSTRNGVTGFRPTFGRVSRAGAMTLAWSMDKLGPMCRSADDCALVFASIHGASPADPTSRSTPFAWPAERPVTDLRVGVVREEDYRNRDADEAMLAVLERMGVRLAEVALPDMDTGPMLQMLRAEASAAFDDLVRSGRVTELVRQDAGAWPTTFRAARFIPAVEYINGARARTLLMAAMRNVFEEVDVIVVPTFGAGQLAITNLTGHPSVTLPNAFRPVPDAARPAYRNPDSITVIGDLYADERVLAVAAAMQAGTDFHRRRPPVQ